MNRPDIVSQIDVAMSDGVISAEERRMLMASAEAIGVDREELAKMIEARHRYLRRNGKVFNALKQCPSCHARIESEMAIECSWCGASLTSMLASARVGEFQSRMAEADSQRRLKLIESIELPTLRNDVVSFLSLATQAAVESLKVIPSMTLWSTDADRAKTSEGKLWYKLAWSIIINSRILYMSDASMLQVLASYEDLLQNRMRVVRTARVSIIAVVCLCVLAFGLSLIDPVSVYEAEGFGEVVSQTFFGSAYVLAIVSAVTGLILVAVRKLRDGSYSLVVTLSVVTLLLLLLMIRDVRREVEDVLEDYGAVLAVIGIGWFLYRKWSKL
jgi:hypothetical protein